MITENDTYLTRARQGLLRITGLDQPIVEGYEERRVLKAAAVTTGVLTVPTGLLVAFFLPILRSLFGSVRIVGSVLGLFATACILHFSSQYHGVDKKSLKEAVYNLTEKFTTPRLISQYVIDPFVRRAARHEDYADIVSQSLWTLFVIAPLSFACFNLLPFIFGFIPHLQPLISVAGYIEFNIVMLTLVAINVVFDLLFLGCDVTYVENKSLATLALELEKNTAGTTADIQTALSATNTPAATSSSTATAASLQSSGGEFPIGVSAARRSAEPRVFGTKADVVDTQVGEFKNTL